MSSINLSEDVEIQGRDIFELMKNQSESMYRSIYAQYSMRNFGKSDLRMIIKNQLKLVKRFNLKAKGRFVDEFYNLNEDPEEKNNLIKDEKYFNKIAELENRLLSWMERINDEVVH